MRSLSVLGSTGSIGVQTLAVAAAFPERFRVTALAAGRNVSRLAEQARRFRPERISVAERDDADTLRSELGSDAPEIGWGDDGLDAVARHPADVVVAGLVGAVGLRPTLAAIDSGRTVALANKEVLVMAGALVGRAVERAGTRLLPVDSEHSAIFQALAGQRREDVRRIVLTASGGPFRDWDADRIAAATVEEALRHPNWDMGAKITIDSATLMNKGLEVVEARWLFDAAPDELDVVVHPESIVHSFVDFVDGSVIAQLGAPDMRGPIALALTWPERLPLDVPRLDLTELARLHFETPDRERFPCLALAFAALRGGEAAPAALNAANEVAVATFLAGGLSFPGIAAVNGQVLDAFLARAASGPLRDLPDVLEVDAWARAAAADAIGAAGTAPVAAAGSAS